ncbi:MAG: outer membrane protein transport protein [Rikenellaceae bacterium]
MKKIILFALAAAFTANASAEGYQVNTLSAKQLGMAHTGVSQKLNSESVWFNPAAAAYQDQKFTIAGGVTGIAAVATCVADSDGVKYESDNDLSTPIYLNLNYKITDDLAFGLNFNTPYGSSMTWDDDWAGMDQVQNISMQSYAVQPTLSYKLFNDKLSIGAGLMMSWGSFELSKSLINPTTAAYLDGAIAEGAGVAAATLSGDAAFTFGFNVGLMYDVNEKWSIGASYRSRMNMVVDEGDTELNFGSDYTRPAIEGADDTGATAALFSLMEGSSFTAELPMPSTLSVGVTYLPTERWKVSAEMQMVGWGVYESLDFIYPGYTSSSVKDYDNTMIYRLGAEYRALEWLTARAGFYYDESPVQDEYFSPETPSMNKLGYTAGFSFAPCGNLSIDLAYAYIAPQGYSRQSTLAAFGGEYRAVANVGSIGLSWGF